MALQAMFLLNILIRESSPQSERTFPQDLARVRLKPSMQTDGEPSKACQCCAEYKRFGSFLFRHKDQQVFSISKEIIEQGPLAAEGVRDTKLQAERGLETGNPEHFCFQGAFPDPRGSKDQLKTTAKDEKK